MSLLKSSGERTTTKPGRRPGTGGVAGATPLPQVNLLPMEILSARGLRSTKRLLGLVVVACVLAVVGAAVFAGTLVTSAQDELAEEQTRTEALLAEKLTYAEVPVVLKRLTTTQDRLEAAASTEIDWRTLIETFGAATPATILVQNIQTANVGPFEEVPTPVDLFQRPAVARLTLTGYSVTRPDTVAWMDSLEAVDIFSDARLTVSTHVGFDGEPLFVTVVSVEVLGTANTHKFVPEETR